MNNDLENDMTMEPLSDMGGEVIDQTDLDKTEVADSFPAAGATEMLEDENSEAKELKEEEKEKREEASKSAKETK